MGNMVVEVEGAVDYVRYSPPHGMDDKPPNTNKKSPTSATLSIVCFFFFFSTPPPPMGAWPSYPMSCMYCVKDGKKILQ